MQFRMVKNMFGKPKKYINIVIEDYAIRILENSGKNISSVKKMKEKPLPLGLIENGKIKDEIGFYEFMKETVKEFGIKHRHTRFYVPNSLIIMRQFEFPANLKGKEIKEYVRDEIGKSIHLPFKEPVFDVHYLPEPSHHVDKKTEIKEMQQATLFAAPKEEMQKYTEIFADVSLKPIAADVEALGVYRLYHHLYETNPKDVYLFAKFNVNSIDISIFHQNQLEFLRYQILDLQLKGWKIQEETKEIDWLYEENETQLLGIVEDTMLEMERVMNFYQFSIKKGEHRITEIIVLGDHPLINHFYDRVKQQFDISTIKLKGYVSRASDKEIEQQYIPALGLALKGGTSHAS